MGRSVFSIARLSTPLIVLGPYRWLSVLAGSEFATIEPLYRRFACLYGSIVPDRLPKSGYLVGYLFLVGMSAPGGTSTQQGVPDDTVERKSLEEMSEDPDSPIPVHLSNLDIYRIPIQRSTGVPDRMVHATHPPGIPIDVLIEFVRNCFRI